MIRGFNSGRVLEPETPGHLQWGAALGAGAISGAIVLLAPRGSPWSGVTFFTPVIMGRFVPQGAGLPLAMTWLVHLTLSILYGLIIGRLVSGLVRARAIVTGGVVGLVLYALDLGVVRLLWPGLVGNEISVVLTHLVFGLLAAGLYRGLLKRKAHVSPG